jgi:hypothetical protein
MIVSVVVGVWYMSVSRYGVFQLMVRSTNFMLLLSLCAGLSFMLLCILFMYVFRSSGCSFLPVSSLVFSK